MYVRRAKALLSPGCHRSCHRRTTKPATHATLAPTSPHDSRLVTMPMLVVHQLLMCQKQAAAGLRQALCPLGSCARAEVARDYAGSGPDFILSVVPQAVKANNLPMASAAQLFYRLAPYSAITLVDIKPPVVEVDTATTVM